MILFFDKSGVTDFFLLTIFLSDVCTHGALPNSAKEPLFDKPSLNINNNILSWPDLNNL